MHVPAIVLITMLALMLFADGARAEPSDGAATASQRLLPHLGRPVVHIDGKPTPFAAYSAIRHTQRLETATNRFFQHNIPIYLVEFPQSPSSGDYYGYSFWVGNDISEKPIIAGAEMIDQWVGHILKGSPDAKIILRMWTHEPASWRKINAEQLVVNEQGETLQVPSLASEPFWDGCARSTEALIRYCESRPWAAKHLLGYANFLRVEGTHESMISHWLYDHSGVMTSRWRAFLREKYKTVEALRTAHKNPEATFENVPVPKDKLRGKTFDVSALPYWQGVADNAPLRDYLQLSSELFRDGFKRIADISRKAAGPDRVLVYDGLKQPMQGWTNLAFFDREYNWPLAYADINPGSGSIAVTPLFHLDGVDGLITPHDYQARGLGGVFEPEAPADSLVLRGKLYLCEMDTRTYTGRDPMAPARDDKEFAAISWRNVATALTRGFNVYWMDLQEDWFANQGLHKVIGRQVEVIKESLAWRHQTPEGIAVILDDAAVFETSGAGNYFNEAIMWELKMGLARCGVPYRIYLLEDLALDNFPDHRVYYFPNLFKMDDARLALVQKKICRDGRVVLWGPGSGISDGSVISDASASRLTGFKFELQRTNYQRRTLVSRFDHPITRLLRDDTVLGGPLPYGPVLYPLDGESLGMAWAKYGRNLSGLAVKSFGKGAAGDPANLASKHKLGPGDWASVFSTTMNFPADFWRGLARYAGAHVYNDDNDVTLAGGELLAVHGIRPGKRTLRLPEASAVIDVVTGKPVSGPTKEVTFDLDAPETRVLRLVPCK